MSGAVTYCGAKINGRACGNRIELPVPYTWKDVVEAMCSDCRRANVEALAASEVDERLQEGAK